MTAQETRFGERPRQAARSGAASARLPTLVLPLLLSLSAPVHAQIFGDRPPPIPPASVPLPEGIGSGAVSLAPPSGPGAAPVLPPSILAPPVTAAPGPAALPPPAAAAAPAPANQAVLALSARFGKDMPGVTGGVIWRVYADRPDPNGAFRLLREERAPTPNIVLPPGSYVVHASLGLASAVRAVTLRQDTTREQFEIPAGGLRIEGRVGTTRIPSGQVTFNIYKGSQFDAVERAPIAQNVPSGDIALIPEGPYYIISNYGDGNSVVRSDIRVQAGKLTDITVTHRAALIVLKLVSERGGEALANTSWSVLTPGGDIVKESIGAFPRVVLAEGQYRAIARYEGRVYERSFDVVNGVDGEIEVLSR
jgi:hypothetical protein